MSGKVGRGGQVCGRNGAGTLHVASPRNPSFSGETTAETRAKYEMIAYGKGGEMRCLRKSTKSASSLSCGTPPEAASVQSASLSFAAKVVWQRAEA